MSRTKKKHLPKNKNTTTGDNDDNAKERIARGIAKRERKRQLALEKETAKARKKERRRLKRSENKVQQSRNDYVKQDLQVVHKDGYICLMGNCVERFALQMSDSVPERALNQRRMRDGYPYHITIANAKQTTSEMRSPRSLEIMNKIAVEGTLPVNLGLGMVRHAENESRSWFCAISWPAGQQIRRYFNLLPRDLHLTLGFDHKDIHIHKGPSTLLIHNTISSPLTKQQVEGLTYAALVESYISREASLRSLSLALAQAESIRDENLISSIANSMNRVQTGISLEEVEGPFEEGNITQLTHYQTNKTEVEDLTAQMESMETPQQSYTDTSPSQERSITTLANFLTS
ncbi:hypothetical protein NQZ79_g8572 [Umbelopsis isabellina]|nr:hypothetical protein NQZ79_g8572 [Umbelopsis isabellina]